MRFKLIEFSIICSIFLAGISKTLSEECGKRKGFNAFSFGGQETRKNDWPWLVAFIHRESGKFSCGGSLLSRKHVLSAAHCFQNKGMREKLPPYAYSVLVGKHDLEDYNESGSKEFSILKYFLHPDWDFNSLKYDADIAIVFLSQEVDYSNGIQPICLPSANFDEVVGTGSVVGWGRSGRSNYYSRTPNKLDVPAINSSHCYTTTELATYSSNRAFCGGYENQKKSPCGGDSGSGFYLKESSKWNVRGIVSGGLWNEVHECNINTFTLYTNVARFIDWIGKTMAETKQVVIGKKNAECRKGSFIIQINLDTSTYRDGTFCAMNTTQTTNQSNDENESIELNFTIDGQSLVPSQDLDERKTLELEIFDTIRLPINIIDSFPNLNYIAIEGSIEAIEPEDFIGFKDLEYLSLYHYLRIKTLHENAFSELINLKNLYINCEKLKTIPKNIFKNNAKLEFVRIFGYKKTQLDKDLFGSNSKLTIIILSSNMLNQLDKDLFASNSMLQEIDLSENKLTQLDKDLFASNLRLEKINLSHNKLIQISVDFMKLPNLGRVNLGNNPCINEHWSLPCSSVQVLECSSKTLEMFQNKIKTECQN